MQLNNRINQWTLPGWEDAPTFPWTNFDNPDTNVDTDTVVVFEAATSLAVSACYNKVVSIIYNDKELATKYFDLW